MEHNGFEYIDLGLPSGTLWATMNVGANNVNDCGLFFPFRGKVGFTINDILNKSIDISTSKETNEDAVNIYMGGDWRTPTKEDIDELVNAYFSGKNNSELLTNKSNRIFRISINGRDLFFPTSGYVNGKSLVRENSTFIWSTTKSKHLCHALAIINNSEGTCLFNDVFSRCYGHNLRGVITRR